MHINKKDKIYLVGSFNARVGRQAPRLAGRHLGRQAGSQAPRHAGGHLGMQAGT